MMVVDAHTWPTVISSSPAKCIVTCGVLEVRDLKCYGNAHDEKNKAIYKVRRVSETRTVEVTSGLYVPGKWPLQYHYCQGAP